MAAKAPAIGQHVLLDIHGASGLDDPAMLERIMRDAAKAAGSTILGAKFHLFGEGQGVTGVLLLAESHMSVHTWPEHGFAAFDIFMCGSAMVEAASQTIAAQFADARICARTMTRGLLVEHADAHP